MFKHNYCILGDSMGIGKTRQALALAQKVNLPTLIVCPTCLQGVWEQEIDKCGLQDLNYKITSYSRLKKAEQLFAWAKMVILDECHYIKSIKAIRTKAIHYYIEKYKPERVIGLSGTPIKNRVTEFFSLILLMARNPKKNNGAGLVPPYHSYTGFCDYFSNPIIQKIKGNRFTTYVGVKNTPQLLKLLEHKYIRRKAKDVLDLPDLVRIDVPIARVISEDKKLKDAWEEFNGKKDIHISTAKMTSALMKADFTAEYVTQLLTTVNAVVVFTDHVDSAKRIHSILSNSALITGATSAKDRTEIVKDFNEGKYKVLVGTIGATSVGYTLNVAYHTVFNDLSWIPGDNAQAEKRIHRIGQKKKCFIHRIYRSKIDFMIMDLLTSKIEVLNQVMEVSNV